MSQKKLSIAVAGATGYVGLDLVYYLSKHPKVRISYLCAQKKIGTNINKLDSRIKKKLPRISNLKHVNWNKVDLLYLSLPNSEAQKLTKKLFKYLHLKFIDLSADFRIENSREYKKWYSINHSAKNLIKKTIYSIPEFTRRKIKDYRIIANPGCYPTSIQLALVPILKPSLINFKNIIIDSKSGYSGAGKNYKRKFKHKNLEKSVFAYGLVKHRHMSELDEQFSYFTNKKVSYTFNPHLIPTFRGLMSTIYLETKKKITAKKIYKILFKFHKKNKFVKVLSLNKEIGTGDVIDTNSCFISISQTRIKNRIIIHSVIDNLIKGASGQAIQNMNLLYGLKEESGLK